MPAPISMSKSITRNNEYCNEWIKKRFGSFLLFGLKLHQSLTAASRHVFSRRAPTQPVKPMINVIVPLQIKINAGSNAIVVSLEILLNTSFSVQAQNPTAIIHSPSSCLQHKNNNRMLNVWLIDTEIVIFVACSIDRSIDQITQQSTINLI